MLSYPHHNFKSTIKPNFLFLMGECDIDSAHAFLKAKMSISGD